MFVPNLYFAIGEGETDELLSRLVLRVPRATIKVTKQITRWVTIENLNWSHYTKFFTAFAPCLLPLLPGLLLCADRLSLALTPFTFLRQLVPHRMENITYVYPSKCWKLTDITFKHLPFQFPGNRKLSFGLKVAAYLSFGFSIPFLASYYQLWVGSACKFYFSTQLSR